MSTGICRAAAHLEVALRGATHAARLAGALAHGLAHELVLPALCRGQHLPLYTASVQGIHLASESRNLDAYIMLQVNDLPQMNATTQEFSERSYNACMVQHQYHKAAARPSGPVVVHHPAGQQCHDGC